ncbi:MAG: hypothetical protein NW216_10190 [Hyphomicrobium sp.]|nr:hypothetical protein [Hyphomicrobium sp.]
MVQRIVFAASGAGGSELWISDGTSAGTTLVKDIRPDGSSNPSNFTAVGNRAFFQATDNVNGLTLWVTDGTAAGTQSVAPATTSGILSELTAFGGRLVYVRLGEVWITDGTTAGTQKLGTFSQGTVADLTVLDGKIYFSAYDGTTQGLWSTDGTAAGTTLIAGFRSRPSDITAFDGRLFFGANDDPAINHELWVSNGTPAGTALFKDLSPSNSGSPHDFVVAGNRMYFLATIANPSPTPTGAELWVSDGTTGGTQLVKDIVPGLTSSNIVELTAFGNKVVFRVNDGVHGQEIWISDGTAGGTFQLRDILPGSSGSVPSGFTVLGDKVFFRANDGEHNYLGSALWVTDGTAAGTTLLKGEIGPQILPAGEVEKLGVVLGNKLYFAAFRGDTSATFTGVELWSTDGTTQGTTLVKDIASGSPFSLPSWLTVFDDGRVNVAPTAVTLTNKVASLAENRSTTSAVKVADITVADDGLGTNLFSLTGADAASFQIVGTRLFLRAGVKLDFETKTSFVVAVRVNDPGVGGNPDATSAAHTLVITNVSPETITGTNGADTLVGGTDRDIISGLGSNDTLNGGAGNDTYVLASGADTVIDAGGIDTITTTMTRSLASFPAIENLTLLGTGPINGSGNNLANRLTGNNGNNILDGGAEKDSLVGGLGNDTLKGGTGNDTLAGGGGSDTFVFNTQPTPTNRDTITDFSNAGQNDVIHLENTGVGVFTLLAAGALSANAFKANATGTATDANDRIIYNTATGALFYDTNGNASGGATQFAIISTKPALTAADFFVI